MKKYIIEFIGTFFLVLVVALTGNPVAIGGTLVALVYMGGYISGAHYNPAVTLGMLLNNKIKSDDALKYIIVQFLGAIVASYTYFFIRGSMFIPQPGQGIDMMPALLSEIVFTFLLVFVILHVAANEKTKGNDYYGLAIGFALMAGVAAVGPISGGVFNPAVGIGPLLFDFPQFSTHTTQVALYFFGPVVGGSLAGFLYEHLKG